jgi:pimeloyl-ACP methyl ester carboxylesterase
MPLARRVHAREAIAWLDTLALLPVAVACRDTSRAEPSPAVIETAQSISRAVSITSPAGKTRADGDDVTLGGHVFGRGSTGVILAHMRPADQTAWFAFAAMLAATGRYTVLTFDFRGFGESGGDKDFDVVDVDLTSAYDYMRQQLHIEKVFLVGASMGGTASLVIGTRVPVAGVVSVSSPGEFPPLDAVAAVPQLTVPKLFITSKDDVPQERSQEEMFAAAPEPKDEEVYDGDAHGTDLLQGPHASEVERRISDFLAAH